MHTNYAPQEKPMMVWDGECQFCHFWIIRWQMITGNRVEYQPFQRVSEFYPDIPDEFFRNTVQLVETNGDVYGGALAVFRTMAYSQSWRWLFLLYRRSALFANISENVYRLAGEKRGIFYKLTVLLWGKDPYKPKPLWLIYMLFFIVPLAFLISKRKAN